MTGKTEFLQERKNRDGSPTFLSSLKGLEGFVTPFYPALKRWAIVTKKQARRNRRSKFSELQRFFTSFAQVSFSVIVRLKTSWPGCESESRAT
jgi:hypothetical protein